MKEPTFVQGLIGSAIPLVVAIAISSICGFLVYLFWFGTEGIMDFLF
jgi:hypothetical protein